MKQIEGDLIKLALEGKFDVIIHGCNCQCRMRSGIAKTMVEHFPEVQEADLKTIKGDKSKLGSIDWVKVKVKDDKDLIIVNAYTQFNYGTDKVNADYDAIRQVFSKIKTNFQGLKIGYPAIGAGLARGNWNIIYFIIKKALNGEDHTFVKYKP